MAIGFGLVGLGRHADLRLVPAIRGSRGARLTAVCSREMERAREFARRHDVPFVYDSLEEMLNNPNVQALCVASPNSLHAEHAIAAARRGKHVLCEKPMALHVEDCRAMLDQCHASKVKLGIGFHLRHHPVHGEARRLVLSGAAGPVPYAQGQWAVGTPGQMGLPPRTGLMAWWSDPNMAGGAAMVSAGVHVIDLLCYMLNDRVAKVAAFTNGQTKKQPLESMAALLLQFRSGAMASVSASRIIPFPENSVVLYGNKLSLAARETLSMDFKGELEVVGPEGRRVIGAGAQQQPPDQCYRWMVEDFVQSVKEGREPLASGADGLHNTEVMLAAFKSARTGRAVTIG
ncbi:MAG: Gfo/Idh/MocA family oxidoreductase [Chloroflexi bacterium]|nr:Gfo/Idh/MocA family oxidoreductase [Chloroflexota bacterium]